MDRWVLASSNSGKLREFQHALAPVLAARNLVLVNQSDLGIAAADEPYATFRENALAKARHASAASGLPALADDSGICVAALSGAPGVRSARYWRDQSEWLSHHAMDGSVDAARRSRIADAAIRLHSLPADEANLEWLMMEMQRVQGESFSGRQPDPDFFAAAFHAAIAFVRSAQDSSPIVVTGSWEGRLLAAPRGQGGFGYDPIFFDPQAGLSAAEMTLEQKTAVSHRAKALRALLGALAW